MTCKPAREALLRRGGHGQKRVSNRVESGCNARDRVLRVSSAGSTSRPRDNEKRGPRSEACHASVWSVWSGYPGQETGSSRAARLDCYLARSAGTTR